ncbi:serine hydrolase domain-containing protein [Nocardia donostiensis]|uniref:Esterase n=1 Tax=Nocardia donostiensis TaxID=1538463 RepID=A0A1V2TBF0_9NOCA|nr:serine hydrolase domain-containing protein [Nocardia donostiensis]ONM46842.1 esterase [Nocardia donostiensis]OQS13191.1 esterase [Nocardia donostiensis]OQS19100.1 esterase [Nocardia donostiensis]
MSSVACSGTAGPEFRRLTSAFARIFGTRRGAGGALAVYLHGEPIVDIWAGSAGPGTPWTRETGALVYSATKGVAATVIHRLADRGLIDYSAPVAEYWPEFAAGGKGKITVRQVMTHSAGLSGIHRLARSPEELLDHELMEERLAAARPDRSLGVPVYHALTYGWLVAGLARSVTGLGMKDLFRQEVAAPLGIDGIHLGRPPADSAVTMADAAGSGLGVAGTPFGMRLLTGLYGVPGAAGAATRSMFVPGVQTIVSGVNPPILDTELAAANGVCTANGLAALYGVLACDGMAGADRYLSRPTMKAIRRIERYRPDAGLFFYVPPLWHLGYHSFPTMGSPAGFGHIGLGGSLGWADPKLGLSVGFVHNRLAINQLAWDMAAGSWLLPLILTGLRAAGKITRDEIREAAA